MSFVSFLFLFLSALSTLSLSLSTLSLLTSSTGMKMSTQMFPRATASKRFSSCALLRLVPLLPGVEEVAVAAAAVFFVCRCPWR